MVRKYSNRAVRRKPDEPPAATAGRHRLGAIKRRATECHTHAIDTTAALYRNRRTDNLAANEQRGRTNVIHMQSTPRQLCTAIGGRITSRRTGGADGRTGWSENAAAGRRDENPMSRRQVLPGGTDLGAINRRAAECHMHAIDTAAALHRNRRTDNLAANGRHGRTGRLVRKYSNRSARQKPDEPPAGAAGRHRPRGDKLAGGRMSYACNRHHGSSAP